MNELQVKLKCPFCKQSLMDESKVIDGHSSIKTVIQHGDKRAVLHLSSIYGSYNIDLEIPIPEDEIVLFFCPVCSSSLLTKSLCDVCHAPAAFFELFNGGKVEICTRRGCKEHSIKYSDQAQKISALYNVYEVFADPSRKG
jgi:hypothetical protein